MDPVLQARAKMSENKVNGPDDAVCERDDQAVAQEYHYEVFSGTFHGSDGSAEFMEDRETGVFTKTIRGTQERDRKLQGHCADVSDVEVGV